MPLGMQIDKDAARRFAGAKQRTRTGKGQLKRQRQGADEDTEEPGVVSSDVSRKILSFAREQLEEENAGERGSTNATPFGLSAREAAEADEDAFAGDDFEEDEHAYEQADAMEELEVCAEDERALEQFMRRDKPERRTLADIIMAKFAEKEAQARQAAERQAQGGEGAGPGQGASEGGSGWRSGLSQQLADVYQDIGKLMSRYRSGRVPKAFKIIPALRNWEEVLYYTRPETWSPQAMFVATRLFASNLNPRMSQRFYALILLPAVRDDIAENKKLNYHLYQSLKKALFRPDAFFKGILLPLCEGGDCTLREAAILGSVLAKVSIPMLHSAAAVLKMASMPYSGATSLFVRVLLNKKYSLPYKAIDSLLMHFLEFRREKRALPVLWHQSLLVFAQRYKTSLTPQQKDALKPLLRQHFHHMITPEVRRELFGPGAASAP